MTQFTARPALFEESIRDQMEALLTELGKDIGGGCVMAETSSSWIGSPTGLGDEFCRFWRSQVAAIPSLSPQRCATPHRTSAIHASMTTSPSCRTGNRTSVAGSGDLIHAADPEVAETIKRSAQPFRREQKINAKALTAMLKTIIANNRAGGWRKLKQS
jgi:hypothetical protein